MAVPTGTSYTRFALFDDFTDGNGDLDMYVYRGGSLVGISGSGTSQEEVNFVNPTADTYTVWVHRFATDGPGCKFHVFDWVLDTTDAGNMTITGAFIGCDRHQRDDRSDFQRFGRGHEVSGEHRV